MGENDSVVTVIAPTLTCEITQYETTYVPTDGSGPTKTSTIPAAKPAGTVTPIPLTGLNPGEEYSVSAVGKCADGTTSPGSAVAFVTTNPPPTPSGKPPVGHIWGDPHFEGFDGVKFDFHGVPKKRYSLMVAAAENLDISGLMSRVPNTPKDTTVLSELRVASDGDVVTINLWRLAGKRKFNVTIGSAKPIIPGGTTVRKTMPGGTKVVYGQRFSPPAYAIITTPNVRVLATLHSVNDRPTNGLNVYVTVNTPLLLPVTGILGVTYTDAAAQAR